MMDGRIVFMRRATAIILASTILFWSALILSGQQEQSLYALRALSTIRPVRPIIYTFVTSSYNDNNSNAFTTWQDAWTAAGYDARPLYLSDAQQHEHYKTFAEAVSDQIPFGHDEAVAYHQYLAMITVGGGMLAHVNVFPLQQATISSSSTNGNNDSDGSFTVHCGSANKPSTCLMSGSSTEWERITVELLHSLQSHDSSSLLLAHQNNNDDHIVPSRIWTHELAMQELASFGNRMERPLVKHEPNVVSTAQAKEMQSLTIRTQCNVSKHKMAVKLLQEDMTFVSEWQQYCANTLQSRIS